MHFKNKSKEFFFFKCFPFGENMPIFCSLGADNYNIIR